jgi:hypothetical protein
MVYCSVRLTISVIPMHDVINPVRRNNLNLDNINTGNEPET